MEEPPPCPVCEAHYLRARSDGRHEAWTQAQQRKQSEQRAAERGEKTCPYCSQPGFPHASAVTCGSAECKRLHNNARARRYQRQRVAECRSRGESYYAKWRTPEYYAALDELPKDPVKNRSRKQEGWHRRRAQKRAVPFETFRHVDVFERDGWVRQLCSQPVDPALMYPDLMSASLDHIRPLSLTGHHVWDNVQLAHLDCNTRKQARVDWEPEVPDGCTEDPRELGGPGPRVVAVDHPAVRVAPG